MARRRDDIRDALRSRVANGLHLGLLRSGDRLASARETARELGTDYRVVVGALRELAREGLVEIRPRAGIFVRTGAGRRPSPTSLLGFGNRLIDLLLDEVGQGVSVGGIAERVHRWLAAARLRAACIECNRDQIEFLCHELRVTYGLTATGVEIENLDRDRSCLHHVDLLVSTSFHADEVRHLAAWAGKPWLVATLDPRRRSEIARRLAEGPVYFIGTDRRWAAKARAIWAGVPGEGNLHPLTIGHDRLDDIPEDAPVMVMTAARPLLAGSRLLARALPARGFSRETGRQILAFVLQANVAS
jgi:DNA-binding transcriptional regulator YhcF (GntR family)